MIKLFADVERRGCATKAELLRLGNDVEFIRMSADSGRLVRVRKGWYALPDEDDDVIRAWRVGGRLACLSALALHDGPPPPPELHVEVPGNTARLRSPDDRRKRLSTSEPVVIHWARVLAPGDRRSMSREAALAQAATCRAQAGVSASASRIV